MKNQSLIHDTAMASMQAVMDELKDDLPYERKLAVMYLIYYSFKAGLESYEQKAERRERRLHPGRN